MARRHLSGTFRTRGRARDLTWGRSLGRSAPTSGDLAHLRCMEHTTDSVSSVTSPGSVVLAGGFEPVLSLRELAEQLDVSVQALYDLRSQGRGPVGFRVGRCLRFRRSEVDAWLTRLEHEDAVRQGQGQP